MAKIIAISNQKGGVEKTSVTKNLGVALVRQGQKVLLLDLDPQGNLTTGLGYKDPATLPLTISNIITKLVNMEPLGMGEGIISHEEGVDLMPANHDLSGFEASLVAEAGRDFLLKRYVEVVKPGYDFILIDCQPSTNVLTINAFVAANSILIPTQAEEYSKDGIDKMLFLFNKIKNSGMNPTLCIEGLLFTMWGRQTNYATRYKAEILERYAGAMPVFEPVIPYTVRMREANDAGVSIFKYDTKSKAAEPFEQIGKEIIGREQRRKESRNQFQQLVPGCGTSARSKKPYRRASY